MENEIYIKMRKIADILQWYPAELHKDVFSFLTQAYFPEIYAGEEEKPALPYIPDNNHSRIRNAEYPITSYASKVEQDFEDDSVDAVGNEEMPTSKPKSDEGKNKAKVGKKVTPKTYAPDTTLNLKGDSNIESFKGFCEKFQNLAESKVTFSVVATYYLSSLMGFTKPTLNQIMTCYKELKVKPYNDFRQTFRDAKREGYLQLVDDSVELTQIGINLVEHDLPRVKTGE